MAKSALLQRGSAQIVVIISLTSLSSLQPSTTARPDTTSHDFPYFGIQGGGRQRLGLGSLAVKYAAKLYFHIAALRRWSRNVSKTAISVQTGRCIDSSRMVIVIDNAYHTIS